MDSVKERIEFEVGEYVWNQDVGLCLISKIEEREDFRIHVIYTDTYGTLSQGWDHCIRFEKLTPLMKELL